MIINVNKENFDLLAIAACPFDMQSDGLHDYCILEDDAAYYGQYNGLCLYACRACWLKWLSKESEDTHEK